MTRSGILRWGRSLIGCALGLLLSGSATADAGPSSQTVADHLAGAIRFETISPEDPADFDPAPFVALTRYLRALYPRTFAALRLEKVNDYSLVFEWKGSDPSLAPALFMSHLDVVPVEAQARAEWTHPPFAGAIEDGYVWGRGSLDVKTGVIFWLEAVETLLSQGFEPRRTIYLAFGHDEEIAGPRGGAVEARLFAERGVHFAFVFDEGGLIVDGHPLLPDQTVAMVMTAEKAYYTVKLTAHGVSGHSSMPPPSTAIGQLARAIVAVEDNPMPTRLIAPLREMFTVLAPHLPLGERLVFDNLWLTSGLVEHEMLKDRISAPLVRTTFAATVIEGGVKENVIPEFAQATINVRILPGDTPEDVLAHLEKVIDDPGIEIEGTSWGVAGKPASIDGPAFQLASEAIHDVLPDAVVVPGLVAGATDSRYFTPVADEVLRFVPERIGIEQASGAHGRDERIAVETLGDSVEIAIGMVRRAGDPAPGP